jgi:MscS family membrane protein
LSPLPILERVIQEGTLIAMVWILVATLGALLWFATSFFADQAPHSVLSGPFWQRFPYPEESIAHWLYLVDYLCLTLIVVEVLRLALRLLSRGYVEPFARHWKISTSTGMRRSLSWLGAAILWYAAVPYHLLPYPATVEFVIHTIFVVSGTWLVMCLWDAFCDHQAANDEKLDRLLVPVVVRLVRVTIVVCGFLVLISTYSVDWKSILTGLGLSGAVIALAAKNTLENVFGSITVAWEMPFELGDLVRINGVEGTVEDINLLSTRLRTAEDSLVTIPNACLTKELIENLGARRYRRQRLFLKLGYNSKPQVAKAVVRGIKEYLDGQGKVAAGKTIVELNDLNEASFSIIVQCFLQVESYEEEIVVRGEIIQRTLEVAEKCGANFVATPQ